MAEYDPFDKRAAAKAKVAAALAKMEEEESSEEEESESSDSDSGSDSEVNLVDSGSDSEPDSEPEEKEKKNKKQKKEKKIKSSNHNNNNNNNNNDVIALDSSSSEDDEDDLDSIVLSDKEHARLKAQSLRERGQDVANLRKSRQHRPGNGNKRRRGRDTSKVQVVDEDEDEEVEEVEESHEEYLKKFKKRRKKDSIDAVIDADIVLRPKNKRNGGSQDAIDLEDEDNEGNNQDGCAIVRVVRPKETKDKQGDNEMIFYVPITDTFGELAKKVSAWIKIKPVSKIILEFDGENMNHKSTLDDEDIEAGEEYQLDVKIRKR